MSETSLNTLSINDNVVQQQQHNNYEQIIENSLCLNRTNNETIQSDQTQFVIER